MYNMLNICEGEYFQTKKQLLLLKLFSSAELKSSVIFSIRQINNSSGVTKVQNGIGDKIGALQHAIFMLLGGIVIGFIYGWKLTLVIIAMSPLLFIGAFATGKVIYVLQMLKALRKSVVAIESL